MATQTGHLPATSQLWERPLPVSRDRSATLSREELAHTAFAIAEAENLSAVSVKRVASKLGVPAARLEQYLPARDDLLDLMLEVALSEIETGQQPVADPDWRAGLRAIALATHVAAERHPWLAELIGARPPSGPNGLRYLEHALGVVCGSGADVLTAANCVNAVLAFVSGSVRTQPVRKINGAARRNAEYLNHAVAAPEYPYLADLFSHAAAVTSENSFEQGLDYLLDGIARRIQSSAADSASASDSDSDSADAGADPVMEP